MKKGGREGWREGWREWEMGGRERKRGGRGRREGEGRGGGREVVRFKGIVAIQCHKQ